MPEDALPMPTNPPASSLEEATAAAAPHLSLHGHGLADSTTAACLPPALTPATTHRQSVSLGALSNFWSSTGPNPTSTPNSSSNPPTTSTTSPDPPPFDDSTINTTASSLHHSAALRALNPGSHRTHRTRQSSKAPSSNTSLSSQPVVVRTYSGSRSRPSSAIHSPRLLPGSPYSSMNGHASSPRPGGRLPAVDEFSFSGILRAVDPEIRDAIDAIAEICARSRLSLADEYEAHLPPQGEIVNAGMGAGYVGLIGRARGTGHGHGLGRTGAWGEHALTAVPEASSSSERLAGESRGSVGAGSVGGKGDGRSAYGSLKSVMGGGKRKRGELLNSRAAEGSAARQDADIPGADQREAAAKPSIPHWAVTHEATPHPSITLATPPTASKQLSLDVLAPAEEPDALVMKSTPSQVLHRRHTSVPCVPPARSRSSTLSSLASWIPWSRAAADRPSTAAGSQSDATKAEMKLKDLLRASEIGHSQERDKAAVGLG